MTELKLDFDGIFPESFFHRLFLLVRYFKFKIIGYRTSKTAHGYHVLLVTDREFDDMTTVFFQLFLGSDHRREMLNLIRVRSGCKRWNVLFSKKYNSKGKLISEEKVIEESLPTAEKEVVEAF